MPEMLSELLFRVSLGLADPVRDLLEDAAGKLWWPYVLAGLLLAWLAHRPDPDGKSFLALLCDRETWAGRSARADWLIAFVNPVLLVTVLSVLMVNWRPVTSWLVETLHWLGVGGHATDTPALLAGLALTLALFVADDFARWVTHWLQHRSPVLWEFHKVHHSAEVLNFVTLHRHHPLDPLLTSFAVGFAAALVNAVFIACLGETLTVATVAGANVFRVAANAAGGVLRHSPFWLSFGPTVERWAVSPAMHHIHHSADPRHWDRNFGTSLAIWDRLAGTLYIPNGKEVERFGIGAESGTFHSLAGAYLTPFRRATDALIGRKQARARSQHVESVLRCERALDS